MLLQGKSETLTWTPPPSPLKGQFLRNFEKKATISFFRPPNTAKNQNFKNPRNKFLDIGKIKGLTKFGVHRVIWCL